jgi:1-acyl-sn-glycerol-3-phosphate acyltransferase
VGERRRASGRPERTFGWWIAAGLVIAFLRIGGRYRFRHLDRIPRTGPFILTPNHVTDLDVLVSGYTLWKAKRAPRFLAKASLFKVPGLGLLLRMTGQIPVSRGGGAGVDALSAATRVVERGNAVIVYPEGTLTRDPDEWPMRGKSGAVRLALESGIPIIPMAHWGVQQILPRWGKRFDFVPKKNVEILVGEPFDLSRWEGRRDRAALTEATVALMDEITELVEELRGRQAPDRRWDPAEHGQSEFGRPDKPAKSVRRRAR